ncbi:MAG: hypothetical protein J6D21_02035 [Clostridia bacterium]|nr:hypothetical protein [Clostridia bacterium]
MKRLKLINTETFSMIIKPLKAFSCSTNDYVCDDYCGPDYVDYAHCPSSSIDICIHEDRSSCPAHTQDHCHDGDYSACHSNQTDICYSADTTTCNEAIKYDITY